MNSQQLFSILLERLGYESSTNLVQKDGPNDTIPPELEAIWSEAKEALHIDAVYFVANAPVIYFKCFDNPDQTLIAEFHRNVWSQGQVPLIFVVLPNDIKVYNGYDGPQKGDEDALNEPPRVDTAINSSSNVWERLEVFSRLAIESGSFWRDYGYLFKKETRADQTLIANLRYIRRQMIEKTGLSPEYTHSLIGRSIFAFYLQDRGVLPVGEEGFFAQTFKRSYHRYTDLLTSHEDTYTFFEILRKHFNGDMFPVTLEEKEAVRSPHLNILRQLFTVDIQAGGQLLFFWAYNFAFIPIELISAIYEEFLHQEESGQNGAYYTPPMLVDFILDQVMPWSDTNYQISLLDPACGSGIFLVEAYRRLVERWRRTQTQEEKPSFKVLSEILTTSIFGIDIKRQALRVAAFSLYLAMLDYLEPKTIWMDVVFPPLLGKNLIEADFFEKIPSFEGKLFDLIVGNPPWESQLSPHAKHFLYERKLKVGDKQIVQAFLWHASDFCTPEGQIALLSSSKSLLFNKSGPNVSFRRQFFQSFQVKAVFDFSALRKSLFEKGIAPAAVIVYTPQHPNPIGTIFYGAPKPTPLTRLLAIMVLDSNEIKQFPVRQILQNVELLWQRSNRASTQQQALFSDGEDAEEELANHAVNIWKVALWGTSHDYTLLEILNSYPSLGEAIEALEWDSGSGFIRSGPGEAKYCPWLDNALFLEAKDLTRYGIDKSRLKRLPANLLFHRGRTMKRFQAPLVLFKRGQAQRRPGAAYLDVNCTYTNAITGITGSDSNLLKALTALLNSELAQYYLFFSSSSWGVEREEIKAGEMRNLPFPFSGLERKQIDAIAKLVDALAEVSASEDAISQSLWHLNEKVETVEKLEQELNELIYKCFQLSSQEIRLMHEAVQYVISFFNSPENSPAQKKPTIDMQAAYAKAYIDSINFYLQPVKRKLVATIYSDDQNILQSPFLVIEFSAHASEESLPDITISGAGKQMLPALTGLHKLSYERFSRKIYHRRNFRVYDRVNDIDIVSIIKPAEQRFWITSAALKDAEETIAELLQLTKA